MYKRPEFPQLKNRLEEPRKFLQVLAGPRQVGKTTLAQQLMEELEMPIHFASADAVGATNLTWIIQQWETARLKLKQGSGKAFLLIIDEIQKVQNWSEQVKALWDEDSRNKTDLKVLLLGSSRLLLQQGLTESLTGRFELTILTHWSYPEMLEAFDFTPAQFAWFGGYPGAADLIGNEARWKEYIRYAIIETSISKDILMLTRVDKPALLRQLFELGCKYSGQIVAFNKLLGQLQDAGNTTTLSHYLELLDTAGLLTGISKFSKSAIKQRGSLPKFQVYNTALMAAQEVESMQEVHQQPDAWGRIVESAVGAHLVNAILGKPIELGYWRERNNEIDFVLTRGEQSIAMEIKSSKTQSTKGMKAFQKQFQPDKMLLIGEDGIAWQDFLTMEIGQLFE